MTRGDAVDPPIGRRAPGWRAGCLDVVKMPLVLHGRRSYGRTKGRPQRFWGRPLLLFWMETGVCLLRSVFSDPRSQTCILKPAFASPCSQTCVRKSTFSNLHSRVYLSKSAFPSLPSQVHLFKAIFSGLFLSACFLGFVYLGTAFDPQSRSAVTLTIVSGDTFSSVPIAAMAGKGQPC